MKIYKTLNPFEEFQSTYTVPTCKRVKISVCSLFLWLEQQGKEFLFDIKNFEFY